MIPSGSIVLIGMTAIVLTLVALAAFPFLARIRQPAADEDPGRGQRRRAAVLIGIVLVLYTLGGLNARGARARDNDRVERAAREREAALVASVSADRSRFLLDAVFTGRSLPTDAEMPIQSMSVGEDAATIRSQVEVGRARRCVIVTVEGAAPPRSQIVKRRC